MSDIISNALTDTGQSGWQRSPAEIRLMIIDHCMEGSKVQRLTPYATISREWQAGIEKRTFRDLVVQSSKLNEFLAFIRGREQWIRNLVIDIELYRDARFNSEDRQENHPVVVSTVRTIFRTMARWETTAGVAVKFDVRYINPPKDARRKSLFSGMKPDLRPVGGTIASPLVDSPPVPAIRQLVLRREMRRKISTPFLQSMLSKLPRLEHILYEPGLDGLDENQSELTSLARYLIPPTLTRLSIFNGHEDNMWDDLFPTTRNAHLSLPRALDPAGGNAVADLCSNLNRLSLSFVVDAGNFLTSCLRHPSWPNMETFVLTCAALDPQGNSDEASGVLCQAATLARRMPRLTTMAFWNSANFKECAFVYSKEADSCSITTSSSWGFQLDDRCEQAWLSLAGVDVYPSRTSVMQQIIYVGRGSFYQDVVLRLGLPSDVSYNGFKRYEVD